jgi:hypothetical protein
MISCKKCSYSYLITLLYVIAFNNCTQGIQSNHWPFLKESEIRTTQVKDCISKLDSEIFFSCEVLEIILFIEVIRFAGGSRYHLFGIRI